MSVHRCNCGLKKMKVTTGVFVCWMCDLVAWWPRYQRERA